MTARAVIVGPVRVPEPVPVAKYEVHVSDGALWLSVFHGDDRRPERVAHVSSVPMTARAALMLARALIDSAKDMRA